MDVFPCRQGVALSLLATLQDQQGNVITSYLGTEALAATVWAGGGRAISFDAAAAWVDPGQGQFSINVSAAQTSGLEEGRYRCAVTLQDPYLGLLEAYVFAIDVGLAPGSAAAPPAYCTMADLLTYGRAWLRDLQSDDDEEGFGEQRGRARSWLDDLIISRYPTSRFVILGDPGYGAGLFGVGTGALPNLWLRQVLDGGGLILRGKVVEAVAKRALYLIADAQIGPSEEKQAYQALANKYKNESSALAMSLTAEIDLNVVQVPGQPPVQGTNPVLGVFLGASDVRG
jgi:hypothetical protein